METQLDTAFLPSNGVTAELYRAAIGPSAQDYYLKHFLRFDSEGKTSATWHWPAYWATLNWLIYRRMWAWALGYAAALTGQWTARHGQRYQKHTDPAGGGIHAGG